MGYRYFVIILVALAFMVPAPVIAESAPGSPRFIATYYLSNIRCPSCLTIEKLTEKTLKTKFPEELAGGLLQWRTINIDEKGNFHFVKDYNLYTKSVIISENKDGKEIRWKNLPKVWELLGDEDKFARYLTDEINAFMAGR